MGREAGFDDHRTKSVDPDVLLPLVAGVTRLVA